MSNWTSNLYQKPLSERQALVAAHSKLTTKQAHILKQQSSAIHNQLIENYVMDYQIPEGLLVNLVVNGRHYLVPMATEEPSVVAAACNGAKRVAASGGFQAAEQSRIVRGQVIITDAEQQQLTSWCRTQRLTILKVANDAHPSMKKRGAGAQDCCVRQNGAFLSLDILIDVDQAMGANSVNTMAEAVGKYCQQAGWHVLAAILSNYAVDAVQTVDCFVSNDSLATKLMAGHQVAERIVELSQLAQNDPYRAVTHNKGIMNGIDAVVMASGNDWRAVEAGAHAYAARSGQYRGLSQWTIVEDGLHGTLALPLTVGVVGGSIKLTSQSRINYQMSQIQSAQELSTVIASVGLAQNLAALRALATSGIQAGHMKLQYRSLAISVGAQANEIEPLVKLLQTVSQVDTTVAKQLLQQLRKE
ncbi:hydroxymethylglutaryl-CoA reductase, degradative [uncultured Limosilactobacillus sp.]|uniref:hydroxymethylglutaryl-CoA reductase, degradative n=1 Tax=uncultured Limosilactobacillus sp. TaxID=2837629 RepID=UPI0025DF0177|nr:hydroxymethylglutaryl-CoA reductase, degradative [uncultured Limosilactobacillus sp.]